MYLCFALGLTACGVQLNEQQPGDASLPDSGMQPPMMDGRVIDPPPPPPPPTGPFGTPAPITAVASTGAAEDDETLDGTETEMILAIVNGSNSKDLYSTRRASATAAWGPLTRIDILATTGSDSAPRLSADGLALYYGTTRGGSSEDVWRSQRANATAAWGTPTVMPVVNSSGASDRWYTPCGGRYMMISDRVTAGDFDLYEGVEGAAPTRLALSTSGTSDLSPFLTPDCLILYWSRGGDIYMATRTAITEPWQAKGMVMELSGTPTTSEQDPWMSVDRKRMYFASDRDGGEYDIYMATRDK